jgi:hypothetical protein
MTSDYRTNLVDLARTTCLCDVGAPGLWAAVAVAPDGTDHLLVADLDSLGDERVRYDAACAAIAHDQLGPLPATWRARVELSPLRCGQSTKTGRPCRQIVTHAGSTCRRHRKDYAR